MVSESNNSPDRIFTVARKGSGSYSFSLPDGRRRSQTGYRSGPLDKEEVEALLERNTNSFNQLSVAPLYEDSEEVRPPEAVRHKSRAWPVHDRDYTESRFKPTGFTVSYNTGNVPPYVSPTGTQGALGVSSFATGFLPSLPSVAQQEAIAASLLRNSRPSSRDFDLARSIAEYKQAPLAFKASAYVPRLGRSRLRKGRDLAAWTGESYLTWMFGMKPTASDLGYLAELIYASSITMGGLLDRNKIREKKYGTRVLTKDSGGGVHIATTSDGSPTGGTLTLAYSNIKYAYLVPYSSSGNYGNVLWPVLNYSYTRKQLIRTFATWEYFVPAPHEIRSRLDAYKASAEAVLSATRVDEGTVYDLTPWTWMVDWFLDIGGLLRYQRDIVDNQVVATGCGYSVWEEFSSIVHYSGFNFSPSMGKYPYFGVRDLKFTPVRAVATYRKHKRRKGNPYSLAPTWSLTNQQWAIVCALGLARSAGIPISR